MFINNKINFSFTGKSEKVTLFPGVYVFECWGAEGFTLDDKNVGGKGAYVKGTILLRKTINFYIFVGEYGRSYYGSYVFNGGGFGQFTGGGASDIRLKDGAWDDFESLKSRIIVAAGGGGPDTSQGGGSGGGLNGIGASHSEGGTQTRGGIGAANGLFGKGGAYPDSTEKGCGGGGSGYYGGGTSTESNNYGGAGGSSFISGHPGCNAISRLSKEDNITHLNTSYHYSGLLFTSTNMIDGDSSMPSPTASTNEKGHSKNGYIRITHLSVLNIGICSCNKARNPSTFLISQIILLCSY